MNRSGSTNQMFLFKAMPKNGKLKIYEDGERKIEIHSIFEKCCCTLALYSFHEDCLLQPQPDDELTLDRLTIYIVQQPIDYHFQKPFVYAIINFPLKICLYCEAMFVV